MTGSEVEPLVVFVFQFLLVDVGFDDSDIGEMLWRSRRLDRIRLWA